MGRSHRSAPGAAKLREALERSRALLALPDGYRIAVVPASDTGAVEAALWSLLGARAVDVLAWESFGQGWAVDVVEQLGIENARVLEAEYGRLPDLGRVDFECDVVFTWNGTTSGVRVPDGDWIARDRSGLTICDATSAAFATDLPWSKLDVATYSWQKVLGGEAAHGILILGPRAVERLESYSPRWPVPKVFRLTKGGRLNESLFEGFTINTPSMLAVEDYLDALLWAESVGGVPALIRMADRNLGILQAWVDRTSWVDFLAVDPATRSNTSVCLRIRDAEGAGRDDAEPKGRASAMAGLLETEGVAYDVASYRDAPAGLRIWTGPTVELQDLEALLPWLDWAYEAASNEVPA